MSTATYQKCPKCEYIRREQDTAPPWQCPRCGIAYGKFLSSAAPADPPAATTIAPAGTRKRGNRFKTIRITVLMIILIVVSVDTWLTKLRATSWDHPLRVVVYPINGDGSAAAAKYIAALNVQRFAAIEQTMKEQADLYDVTVDEPLDFALAKPLHSIPPLPPRNGNVLSIMWWSLKLRWWAARMDHFDGPTPEIRAFTLYYDPKTHPVLEHSTGLEKSMIGVIKLFASNDMNGENNVVMLHELLHTLGATDKYDLRTDQPLYPSGYAQPQLQPRLPQHLAEIMAGRIPLTPNRAVIPDSLAQVVVGPETAREIGWIK